MEENTIARQNSDRLASLSVMFCLVNGIEPTDEMIFILSLSVMHELYKWYDENEKVLNPQEEFIEDDAIKFAFSRLQHIADLAAISAQTGIGMEGMEL